MTNYGFHTAMREAGIEVATTPVGDRYVLEALRERGWALGGEQSGHIIDMGFVPSGDGIASALLAMEALDGGDLHDRHAMEKLPQTLVNVRVRDREALDGATARPRRCRARGRGARGPRPRAAAAERHRAARPRDGRGSDRATRRKPFAGGSSRWSKQSSPERRSSPPRRTPGRASRMAARPGFGPRPLRKGAGPMCGIVGYVGQRPVQEILLAGLAEARVPRI